MQTLDSQIQDLTSRLSADLMGIIRGARITDLLGVPETAHLKCWITRVL